MPDSPVSHSVVWAVWQRGETIHEGDNLLGLYWKQSDAEARVENRPVYNLGTRSEFSPECYVEQWEIR